MDSYDVFQAPPAAVAVDLAVLTVRDEQLQILLVQRGVEPYRGQLALPGGFVRPGEDLDAAAARELAEETGLDAQRLHLEQLRSYGAPDRDPRLRVVTICYLALAPDLPIPLAGGDASAAQWTRVDAVLSEPSAVAFDHLAIMEDALDRARSKLEYTTLGAAFCRPEFTMSELRRIYQIVWGHEPDPRNFHRKMKATKNFLQDTGKRASSEGGRPATLYRRGPATLMHPAMLRNRRSNIMTPETAPGNDWLTDLWHSPQVAGDRLVVDAVTVDRLAHLMDIDPSEFRITVRCLVALHSDETAAFEMRTNTWCIDLPTAVAKSVLASSMMVTVIQLLGNVSIPAAVLILIAPFLLQIKRVEVNSSDVILHAQLSVAAADQPLHLDKLYELLPLEARAELSLSQFSDVVDRLLQARLASAEPSGLRLIAHSRRRGFRLTVAEPSFIGELQNRRNWDVRPTVAVDVVILTAVGLECEAVREYLAPPWLKLEKERTLYDIGTFEGRHHKWKIAVGQTGRGNLNAALHLAQAVRVFTPRIALFVGIAGGRMNAKVGDVVIAEAIYDYESARETEDGDRTRIKTQLPSKRLVQHAERVARGRSWRQRIKPASSQSSPNAFVRPIASGSKVVAYVQSPTAVLLARQCDDALAVEMEGYGFLQAAADHHHDIDALVIRGISDLLTGKNPDNDRQRQPVAANHAAAFAFELLYELEPAASCR